ncbi:MAG: formate dehydrogenase [Xanthobacteraceae bacterium]|nr:formate dehydrogenase [Xanthobacteraceae bacterium]MBV9632377.1 formate dehydrogenase [Xanthobacteraceae bacterium]
MKQSDAKQTSKGAVGRRDVLKVLGAGAAASAAPLADSAQAETWNEAEHQKARYRLSDHIKAYYRVNRYPG